MARKTARRVAARRPALRAAAVAKPRSRPATKRKPRRRPAPSRCGASSTGALVLGLWAVIAASAASSPCVAANLPPIQSLEVPKRPPSIEIVGLDGSRSRRAARWAAPRADQGAAALPAEGLRRDRGPPLLQPLRRRSDRARARGRRQRAASRRVAGRLDHHPAARQEPVPHARSARSGARCRRLMLALWLERKFSKDEILELYLNRVYFGAGAYGVEAAAQRYFGKSARAGDARRSRDARGPGEIALAARAEPQSRRRRAPRPDRARRHGRTRASSPRRMAKTALIAPAHAGEARGRRLGQLRRRLDHGRARRSGRPRRAGHRGRDHDRSGPAGGGREGAGRRARAQGRRSSTSRRARSSR